MKEKKTGNYAFSAHFYDMLLTPVLHTMRKKITSLIPEGSRVLEIACGTGAQGAHLHRNGIDYTGVDLSPAMLREAGKKKVNCYHADGSNLEIKNGSFDVVTISLALH